MDDVLDFIPFQAFDMAFLIPENELEAVVFRFPQVEDRLDFILLHTLEVAFFVISHAVEIEELIPENAV